MLLLCNKPNHRADRCYLLEICSHAHAHLSFDFAEIVLQLLTQALVVNFGNERVQVGLDEETPQCLLMTHIMN